MQNKWGLSVESILFPNPTDSWNKRVVFEIRIWVIWAVKVVLD